MRKCRADGKILRVAGAQHSAPPAVFAVGDNSVRVKLEGHLRELEWLQEDQTSAVVRVGAGCNLGVDPSDPDSTPQNSFNRLIDGRGYALSILGGMSHQTVGGFLSTSSAGGSLCYGFADAVLAIELVDGLGQVQTLEAGTDEFNAAAVSMGLFGVLTRVTMRLQRSYLVEGKEATIKRAESVLKDGATFRAAYRDFDYVHSVWYAAKSVDNVLQFTANQVGREHKIKPYKHPLTGLVTNLAAGLVLQVTAALTKVGCSKLAACIFTTFQPAGTSQTFCDHWYIALPNDDQALIDSVIRVQFTEIWIDIEEAPKVLQALVDLFEKVPAAAGNFGVEIYAAKRSPFWLSMSFGRDCIRVDPYWFEYNEVGDLYDYFKPFWDLLLGFKTARLHWGKHWPTSDRDLYDHTLQSYPMLAKWKQLRQQFDPDNVFVTQYWNDLLKLQEHAAEPESL